MITSDINNFLRNDKIFIIHNFFEKINNNVIKIIDFPIVKKYDFYDIEEYIFRDLYLIKNENQNTFLKKKRKLKNINKSYLLEEIETNQIDKTEFPYLKEYHKVNKYEICKNKIIDNVILIIKKINNKIRYEIEIKNIDNISNKNLEIINNFIKINCL